MADLANILIILLLVVTGASTGDPAVTLALITDLVIAGLAVTELLPRRVWLDSSSILNLFLPILVFEAAMNPEVSRLRSTLTPIALLAGLGIVLASGVTAVLLKFSLSLV